jgi:hypothetical protein
MQDHEAMMGDRTFKKRKEVIFNIIEDSDTAR